ncbi:DUF2235 domain-containing protein [Vibrio splendidus]|uniref:T6SS phospholipase effector Tle1-like catalytic domain-containing protein n=1 Tax=Vibrio splendidus TaxID=29497 RepID=UPI000C834F02|nr:DUF2235 domain-containing protein [Vibrio splendidus]PMH06861.1 hypothetical protein BCU75_19955 [Vibrio splendidus]
MNRYLLILFVSLTSIAGCSALDDPKYYTQQSANIEKTNRQIVIFFDGTDNTLYPLLADNRNTNVGKLWHHLSTIERNDLLKFYIEGVGAGGKTIGAATGWGIDYRVKKAYSYVLQNYKADDEIHIIGFSRGAYSARILASMLNIAGVPQIPSSSSLDDYQDISAQIYDNFKGEMTAQERKEKLCKHVKVFNSECNDLTVRVNTLILFDTVETLGAVDTWEAALYKLGIRKGSIDVGERNKRYGDQLCNVDLALHALSIDDNRPDVFTPRLLTLDHVYRNCIEDTSADISRYKNVREVWFSGAHSDVGGGYENITGQESLRSNISLKWVYEQLAKDRGKLLKDVPTLETSSTAITHNAHLHGESIYRKGQREIPGHAKSSKKIEGLKHNIHCSVIEKLATQAIAEHEYKWLAEQETGQCLVRQKDGYLHYSGSATPRKACSDKNIVLDSTHCSFTIYQPEPTM